MKYKSKTVIARKVPLVWDQIIQNAEKMIHGEVEVKIQDDTIVLIEFRVKRKQPEDGENLEIIQIVGG